MKRKNLSPGKDAAIAVVCVLLFFGAHTAVDALDRRYEEKVREQRYEAAVQAHLEKLSQTARPELSEIPLVDKPQEIEPPVEEPECADQYIEDIPLTSEEQILLRAACDEFGVEYAVMLSLIDRETDFRNISGDGGDSAGYCQIQRKWWGWLMDEIGAEDLTDPEDNFRTGCAIVSYLTDKHGSAERALTAYNTGKPGTSEYSEDVLAGAEKWTEVCNG